MPHFMVVLKPFISLLNLSWIMKSIFEGYGAFNANSVDPDETPQNTASDLDLHCLSVSLVWDARPANCSATALSACIFYCPESYRLIWAFSFRL